MLAARSKAWVCDRSLAGIVGSNPAGVMCCQVEVSATGLSLVQRSRAVRTVSIVSGRVSGVSIVPRNIHGLILHDGPAEGLVN